MPQYKIITLNTFPLTRTLQVESDKINYNFSLLYSGSNPGGATGEVQYNNGMGFGGLPLLTFNGVSLFASGLIATGSLYGTSSWAINALTASYFSGSISDAISASYALTASYALNGGSELLSNTIYLHSQSVADVTWSVNHNLDSQYPVITVYGSDNNVIVPQEIDIIDVNNLKIYFPISSSGAASIIGNILFTTSSFPVSASYAISSSYAQTASYALNAAGTSVIAVTGSTLYSTDPAAGPNFSTTNSIFFGSASGENAINAQYSNFIGSSAGYLATNANNSNFIGAQAGQNATYAADSNFFGTQAGYFATESSNSNFLGNSAGAEATNAYNSNFLGAQAGYRAVNADNSNFIGGQSGQEATYAYGSNFLGNQAGRGATSASYSNFFGQGAGFNSLNASHSLLIGYQVAYNSRSPISGIGSNNIIIGTNITLDDDRKDSINLGAIIFATGSYSTVGGNPFSGSANGRVGINVVNPKYGLDVSGSTNIIGNLITTGSTISTLGFTGSLLGTSSYAITASYALNGGSGGSAFPYTGSAQITGSLGVTGSTNIFGSLINGENISTIGQFAHSEGEYTYAIGNWSHAEGSFTSASGQSSHAEGTGTKAISPWSHAEGQITRTEGQSDHAEGFGAISRGFASHAEGYFTVALGASSHAEGYLTSASADYSHAEGNNTIASGIYQHVQGQYNQTSSAQSAFILGNGTDNTNRSNLIFAAGNTVQITGSLQVNGSITGSLLGTASYATTASYALNGGGGGGSPFPYTGSAQITGSLGVTGSLSLLGSYSQSLAVASYSISITDNSGSGILFKRGTEGLPFPTIKSFRYTPNNGVRLRYNNGGTNNSFLTAPILSIQNSNTDGGFGSNDYTPTVLGNYNTGSNSIVGVESILQLTNANYGVINAGVFELQTHGLGIGTIDNFVALKAGANYTSSASGTLDVYASQFRAKSPTTTGSLNKTVAVYAEVIQPGFNKAYSFWGESGSLYNKDQVLIGVTSSIYKLDVNGSTNISGSLRVTGSIISTLGFTGSLLGTSSYATTASYALNGGGGTDTSFNTSTTFTGLTSSVLQINTSSYTSTFIHYLIMSGSNARVGDIRGVWITGSSNIVFDETSTMDIGNTQPVTASLIISQSQAQLIMSVTTAGTWVFKANVTNI